LVEIVGRDHSNWWRSFWLVEIVGGDSW